MTSDLDRLCSKLGITATSVMTDKLAPWADDARRDIPPPNAYRVTLSRRVAGSRRQLTVDFWQGCAITKDPSAADVLNCLCSDAQAASQSFEDWARDLGFDTDSRKAEAIYRACRKLAPRVWRFLGTDFEAVANAEH